jgi:hypothetical protein
VEEIEKLLDHLGYATPVIYAAAAYRLFACLDENASDQAKAALAGTMRLKDYGSKRLASALVELFDRIYTNPLLRWRALSRSVAFTLIVSAIFVLEYVDREDLSQSRGRVTVAFALVANVVTDYASLFVIRPFLVWFGDKPVLALVLGTLVGLAVVALGTVLRFYFVSLAYSGLLTSLLNALLSTDQAWRDVLKDPSLALLIDAYWSGYWRYSLPAFLVLSWLPLLGLGIVGIRALSPLSSAVNKAQWALADGNKHPLKAVGCVAAIVVFALAFVWQILFKA